jgi:putative membrane protein
MAYLYLKALHIIFVVTWFAGLFYMPRLFIYNTEAQSKSPEARSILTAQFNIMIRRLWYGITWPSAIITLIFGLVVLFKGNWDVSLNQPYGRWLLIKLIFVCFLYIYHFSLHVLVKQESKGIFKYSSMQLRIWNEVATIFLVAIVMLATVKEGMSFVWGIAGMVLLIVLLFAAIKIYKIIREGKNVKNVRNEEM